MLFHCGLYAVPAVTAADLMNMSMVAIHGAPDILPHLLIPVFQTQLVVVVVCGVLTAWMVENLLRKQGSGYRFFQGLQAEHRVYSLKVG